MALFTITTWFALGTAGMALGTLLLAWGYTQLAEDHRFAFVDLIAVTGIATVAYGLMALDVGAIVTARGATLYVPRYVDWLLTTPLHVIYLGWLAGADRRTITILATLQAATIVFGFAGGLVATPLNFLLFGVGALTDAIDGRLARWREAETAVGARLDIEADAMIVFAGVVTAIRIGAAPWPAIALGLLRYAFLGGILLRRLYDHPVGTLAPRRRRSVVGGFLMVALTVILLPVVPSSITRPLAIVALGAVLISFALDWLSITGRGASGEEDSEDC